jgi:NAD+ diphosphatase
MSRASIYENYVPAVTNENSGRIPSYWFIFSGNRMLVQQIDEAIKIPVAFTPDELHVSPIRTQYLGLLNDQPCYSVELEPAVQAPGHMVFRDLRALYGALEDSLFLLAGRAFQIVAWDQSHQFCGRCGERTRDIEGERAKICPKCGLINYPRISPAVIIAVIKEDRILLAHAKAFPSNRYSIIAGFVEPGETLEECVARELMEEVSISVQNIRFFGSQPWPFPNSLMIGFTADYAGGEICVDGKEITEAGWFGADDLPGLPPPMSIAREIIDWYISNLSNG